MVLSRARCRPGLSMLLPDQIDLSLFTGDLKEQDSNAGKRFAGLMGQREEME